MEFLYSLNRLNVATSRARCLTLVVASPALVRVSADRRARCSSPTPCAASWRWRGERLAGGDTVPLMNRTLTIHDVPDEVYAALEAVGRERGQSVVRRGEHSSRHRPGMAARAPEAVRHLGRRGLAASEDIGRSATRRSDRSSILTIRLTC